MSAFTPTDERTPDRHEVRAATVAVVRQVFEALVCLAIAVMLFRGFEVEGYMISTGSMAPSLLGFHKRVICPSCGYQFTFGVSFEDEPEFDPPHEYRPKETSDPALAQAGSDEQPPHSAATQHPAMTLSHQLSRCPNCGQSKIDVAEIPRNQGDQLLVNKSAYGLVNPERWEVVVFRNPYKATQAYVKRAVGLPGERVQIVGGEVYADGKLCRKPVEIQRAVRIPVFDNDYEPVDDPQWKRRWVPDVCATPWKREGSAFVIDRSMEEVPDRPDDDALDLDDEEQAGGVVSSIEPELRWSWTTYHHWIRAGGSHRTVVELDAAAPAIHIPEPVLSPVQYEAAQRRLSCIGVLTAKKRDDLLQANPSPEATAAIQELYRESHLSPVTDVYGYNEPDVGLEDLPVRDLMFTAEVSMEGGTGGFVVEMTDGSQTFDCVFDLLHREARLHIEGEPKAARTAPLAVDSLRKFSAVEMSLFNRQVIVTLNGTPLFEPLLLDENSISASDLPRAPVRFGARGLRAEVRSLVLYRDVSYTRGRARNGIEEPYQLGLDEYFVLGDNSPVSADSRSWPDGAVSAHLLVGKPFVVHLPSRPGKLQLGGRVRYIRIPDFARMRYIR